MHKGRLFQTCDHTRGRPCKSAHVFTSVHHLVIQNLLLVPLFLPAFFISAPLTQRRSMSPSDVTAEKAKSMQSNSWLWSIISNLESGALYLRSFKSFMPIACEENLNLVARSPVLSSVELQTVCTVMRCVTVQCIMCVWCFSPSADTADWESAHLRQIIPYYRYIK